jgi:hypothetical protein
MRRQLARTFSGLSVLVLAFCSFDAGGEIRVVDTSDPISVPTSKCVSPGGNDRECADTVSRDLKPMKVAILAHGATRQANDVLAAYPIGAWKLTCVSPDGKDRECVVGVSRAGKGWKGTYQADGETRSAKDVAFEGDVLSIGVDGKFAGQVYRLTYEGKPQGDIFNGTVRWTYGWASGSFPFRGERVVEQVASTP